MTWEDENPPLWNRSDGFCWLLWVFVDARIAPAAKVVAFQRALFQIQKLSIEDKGQLIEAITYDLRLGATAHDVSRNSAVPGEAAYEVIEPACFSLSDDLVMKLISKLIRQKLKEEDRKALLKNLPNVMRKLGDKFDERACAPVPRVSQPNSQLNDIDENAELISMPEGDDGGAESSIRARST